MTCFACEPRPMGGGPRRMLCDRHKAACALDDEVLLTTALDRVRPPGGPLEGSGLAFVFNPVSVMDVSGRRLNGWTDFAAGGMAVFEASGPREPYFGFFLAMRADAEGLLDAVRRAPSKATMLTDLRLPRPLLAIGMDALLVWRRSAIVTKRRLALGHWPTTFSELQPLVSDLADVSVSPGDGMAFFAALRKAASDRG